MTTQGRTLQVYLAADTDQFRRGMQSADKQAKGLKGRLSGLGSSMKANLGPALAGAGLAAGALAISLGVDGVKAAIEDEKSSRKLANTMKNLGLSQDVDKAEEFITKMRKMYGVTDDDLRPAMDILVRSTKDLGEAETLAQLAMDISVGTGKDLQTVSKDLAKAHDGNVTALKKYGVKLDDNIIKSKDFDGATALLAETFKGQAAEAADTLSGRLQRLKAAAEEVQESFGAGFLEGIAGDSQKIDAFTTQIDEANDQATELGKQLGKVGGYILDALGPLMTFNDLLKNMPANPYGVLDRLQGLFDGINALLNPGGNDQSVGGGVGGFGEWTHWRRPRPRPNPNNGTGSQVPSIVINTGVGDPVAIGRAVTAALAAAQARTGYVG